MFSVYFAQDILLLVRAYTNTFNNAKNEIKTWDLECVGQILNLLDWNTQIENISYPYPYRKGPTIKYGLTDSNLLKKED